MKKLLTGIAAVSALALVVSTGSAVHAADKTLNLQFISKGFTAQFWQAVKGGADAEAKKMNATVNFVGPAAETMIDTQLQMLDSAIALKPDGIAYAALGTTQSVSHLTAAHTAGIPVYMFDTSATCPAALGVSSVCALGVANTDSLGAGKLAADKLGALIGGKGKVFVMGHSQTNQTGIDRRDGFVNEIKAKFPKINLLPVQYAEGGDAQKAQDIVSTVLVANKDLAGIYATNEGTAIGAGNAIKAAKLNKGKVKLIGFDSGAQQIDAIKAGYQTGAITQNPVGIGALTVDALVNYIRNKTVPATRINTGFYYYDSKNLTDPKIAADLYQ